MSELTWGHRGRKGEERMGGGTRSVCFRQKGGGGGVDGVCVGGGGAVMLRSD